MTLKLIGPVSAGIGGQEKSCLFNTIGDEMMTSLKGNAFKLTGVRQKNL